MTPTITTGCKYLLPSGRVVRVTLLPGSRGYDCTYVSTDGKPGPNWWKRGVILTALFLQKYAKPWEPTQ